MDELLRILGHEPTAAASGREALVALDYGDYDAVLTDIHMPGMTGLELIAQLRSDRPKLPVIAVTADLMSHTTRQYQALGFKDVVGKPLDPVALRSVLDHIAPAAP